jgi:hypothetical protein
MRIKYEISHENTKNMDKYNSKPIYVDKLKYIKRRNL